MSHRGLVSSTCACFIAFTHAGCFFRRIRAASSKSASVTMRRSFDFDALNGVSLSTDFSFHSRKRFFRASYCARVECVSYAYSSVGC